MWECGTALVSLCLCLPQTLSIQTLMNNLTVMIWLRSLGTDIMLSLCSSMLSISSLPCSLCVLFLCMNTVTMVWALCVQSLHHSLNGASNIFWFPSWCFSSLCSLCEHWNKAWEWEAVVWDAIFYVLQVFQHFCEELLSDGGCFPHGKGRQQENGWHWDREVDLFTILLPNSGALRFESIEIPVHRLMLFIITNW